MKFKTLTVDGKTYFERTDEGKFIDEDSGNEVDAAGLIGALEKRVDDRTRERDEARNERDTFREQAETFGTDARKANETIAALKGDKKDMADRIELVRAEAVKPLEEKLNAVTAQYHESLIGGAFAASKFIADKIAVPLDMVRATFGEQFSVNDEGQLVATDAAGNRIGSAYVGQAYFDDAISKLVGAYPHKDAILKSSGKGGTGALGSGSEGPGAGKTITRSQADQMGMNDPAGLSKMLDQGVSVVDG